MEYRYNGEKVIAISSQMSKSTKPLDECEEMRVEYLRKQGNMLQDIKLESGQVVKDVRVAVLEIIK